MKKKHAEFWSVPCWKQMRQTEREEKISLMFWKMFLRQMSLRGKSHKPPLPDFKLQPVWGVMGAEKSLLNMGLIVPSVFFQPPILRKCTSFLPLPFNLSQPPSLHLTSLSTFPLSSHRPKTKQPWWIVIDNFPPKREKKRLMEKVFFFFWRGWGWEVSFVLHLFHEAVVVDPTSSTEPLCTLSLPKRAPPPRLLPPLPPSWNRLYGLHAWHSSCVGGTAFYNVSNSTQGS